MDKNKLRNKVLAIINEISNYNEADYPDDESLNLIQDLGFNSVAIIELIMKLEDQFSIVIDDADELINALEDVSVLITYISERISEESM